jgi:AraC-like DNA-binding protein
MLNYTIKLCGGDVLNNIDNVLSNPQGFDGIPMCIHKDYYKDQIRTPLICVNNNVVRPNRKLTHCAIRKKSRIENVFSPYHFHEGIEILRILKGKCTVIINETVYEAKQNDVFLINPFESHGIYLDDIMAEFERSCIIFNPSDLFPAKKKSNETLFDMLSGTVFKNYISGNDSCSEELCNCIDNITVLAEQKPKGWQVAVLGQTVMFYSVMLRENKQNDALLSVPYRREFATDVSEYINQNLDDELTTAKVAEHCLYSVEHFCRLFRKCFNRTFKEYLNICRIQRARDLIDVGEVRTVSEASVAVGFNNANHFCNTFKKIVGVTPSQYINKREKKL